MSKNNNNKIRQEIVNYIERYITKFNKYVYVINVNVLIRSKSFLLLCYVFSYKKFNSKIIILLQFNILYMFKFLNVKTSEKTKFHPFLIMSYIIVLKINKK